MKYLVHPACGKYCTVAWGTRLPFRFDNYLWEQLHLQGFLMKPSLVLQRNRLAVGYRHQHVRGQFTFCLLCLMTRIKVWGDGDLCPWKHAISLVTNEPSGNTVWPLIWVSMHLISAGLCWARSVCVCVGERVRERGFWCSREEVRQMDNRALPLWFWTWGSANYILIKKWPVCLIVHVLRDWDLRQVCVCVTVRSVWQEKHRWWITYIFGSWRSHSVSIKFSFKFYLEFTPRNSIFLNFERSLWVGNKERSERRFLRLRDGKTSSSEKVSVWVLNIFWVIVAIMDELVLCFI